MVRHVGALIVVLTFMTGSPIALGQTAEQKKSPEQLVTEGTRMLMEAMRLFLHSVPQFGEPYINEQGDIVIPRLNPEKKTPEEGQSPSDGEGRRRI